MPRIRYCIFVATLLMLGGCIQVNMHFRVRSDGSGTLTTRITMPVDSPAAGMAEMGGEMAGTFSEEGARQQAAQYGPGVTFVRSRKIDDGEVTGIEATYEFENISLVRAAPLDEGEGTMEAATQEVTFLFSPEENGSLMIHLPPPPEPEEAPAEAMDDMALSMQASMMKGMMAGMHIRLAVEIQDGIAEANTINVRDNVVTVYEIDFDRIASNDDNLKAYLRTQNDMSRAAGIIGVVYPENNPITIRFGEPSFRIPTWAYYILAGVVGLALLVFLATRVEIRLG